ncbi:hypothetical protein N7509_008173 [Penicillium cosmopolitanum]|uniref:RelA/SpoT domain-containing protein n=1 Tax=Penicillium cosmopolitanum TaxID=1131564 RepID=A0A9W9W0B7_9EURO|nr:uncharacterized protein N7509_008173 [Penicillium cosmopolitanum]KAJ5392683.1 hypothetical protein N7509_008173 [Penicillium cosmopolitanum]
MLASHQISRLDSSTGTPDNEFSDAKVIESFVNSYESSGYTAYTKLTKAATKILTEKLEQKQIVYEVYNRGHKGFAQGWAKDPASVKRTIRRRRKERKMPYERPDEIENDMHDLAGLRVALYYPNDFEMVDNIIWEHFEVAKPSQDWPDQHTGPRRYRSLDGETDNLSISGRNSRFPGYFARHYRVTLREMDVSEPALEGRIVEIQLVSLLMHTWSKIHHELVYKPRPGKPEVDEDDERLLDISNGLMIAGEQVLRQIQINLDYKKSRARLPFRDLDDLWRHIRGWAAERWDRLSEKQRKFFERGQFTSPLLQLSPMLYNSLLELRMNNPESIDVIFQAAFTAREKLSESVTAHGPFNLANTWDHLSTAEFLYVGLADVSRVIEQENTQLKLQIPNLPVIPGDNSRPSRRGGQYFEQGRIRSPGALLCHNNLQFLTMVLPAYEIVLRLECVSNDRFHR